MTTQILLNISESLYQRARKLAQSRNREIDLVLLEILDNAIPEERLDEITEWDSQIEQEKAAFLAVYPQLWQMYPQQYVAIYQEQVIDHDTDFATLFARIDEQYADEFVLIRRVEAEPEPVYHFPSPRWVESD